MTIKNIKVELRSKNIKTLISFRNWLDELIENVEINNYEQGVY